MQYSFMDTLHIALYEQLIIISNAYPSYTGPFLCLFIISLLTIKHHFLSVFSTDNVRSPYYTHTHNAVIFHEHSLSWILQTSDECCFNYVWSGILVVFSLVGKYSAVFYVSYRTFLYCVQPRLTVLCYVVQIYSTVFIKEGFFPSSTVFPRVRGSEYF